MALIENPQVQPGPKPKGGNWMQRSLAYRTAAHVEAEAAKLTASCRFLQSDEDFFNFLDSDVAVFHRSEVLTCGLLGNGAFSEVHQIHGFRLSNYYEPNIEQARDSLQTTALNPDGSCRYVLKHLRRDRANGRHKFLQAATDLVLEAKFLARLDHPNIIKIKGWAGGPAAFNQGTHDSFFLILDRLDETLSQRLQRWKREENCAPRYSKDTKDFANYREKLCVALQIASAMEYLHERDIIFRDLKPDNIGFKGKDVQLFDFGLVRELPKESPGPTEVFHMSGVGTRRYMAPEVCLAQYYNLKADVYSWTLVFHSMLCLEPPFNSYNAALHQLLVCEEGIRPNKSPDWPDEIKELCDSGWAASHEDRPSMKEVCERLQRMVDLAGPDEETAIIPTRYDSSISVPEVTSKSAWETILRHLERGMIDVSPYRLRKNLSTDYPHYQHLRSRFR